MSRGTKGKTSSYSTKYGTPEPIAIASASPVQEEHDDPDTEEPPAKRPRLSVWDMMEPSTVVAEDAGSVDAEMATYGKEGTIPQSTDPLKWRAVNRHRFPVLSKAARKYLSASPTSVDSERMFNTYVCKQAVDLA
ncbi:hypothetical protein CAPTEDRAFT_213874 [Capitella teleta]|uniref:HAT C-terminal dimerisation domain-containing protein n=1 Tax=Capitella teleta TaxID=283909 RepID=R7TT90_CAPTE|nr:hypothetical protein CAPTEDRAFT_213874 [Capitella teleta]|eukprot:ELT97123.1 hypothetical protein CAPTEDRAFT_213874 [Capitella teleta]